MCLLCIHDCNRYHGYDVKEIFDVTDRETIASYVQPTICVCVCVGGGGGARRLGSNAL
jgi:hypothetical protein